MYIIYLYLGGKRMGKEIRYRLKYAGNLLLYGVKYEFESESKVKITIYNAKYPNGRKVSDVNEEMRMLNMFNYSSNNLDFEPVNEKVFSTKIKQFRN